VIVAFLWGFASCAVVLAVAFLSWARWLAGTPTRTSALPKSECCESCRAPCTMCNTTGIALSQQLMEYVTSGLRARAQLVQLRAACISLDPTDIDRVLAEITKSNEEHGVL